MSPPFQVWWHEGSQPTRQKSARHPGSKAPTGACYDAAAVGLDGSWHYNWLGAPCYGSVCAGHHQAAERAPMMGQLGQAGSVLAQKCGAEARNVASGNWITVNWRRSGVRRMLGCNEPDGHEGGKCSPAAAAADWSDAQRLADKFDPPLGLISPAPISGGGADGHGLGLDGASPWLDQLFGNCSAAPGCNSSRIEFIAMHDYHGNATSMTQRIAGAAKRRGRKIWLTEWAILDWGKPPPRAMMGNFMAQALPLLGASPGAYRRAWLTGACSRSLSRAPGSTNAPRPMLVLAGVRWQGIPTIPTESGRYS